jgi:Protein of unknown function (DUF1348)
MPRQPRCRAKAQRNHNPRVGGSSPSSGMRSACKYVEFRRFVRAEGHAESLSVSCSLHPSMSALRSKGDSRGRAFLSPACPPGDSSPPDRAHASEDWPQRPLRVQPVFLVVRGRPAASPALGRVALRRAGPRRCRDTSGQRWRSYGNEQWEFDAEDFMRRREEHQRHPGRRGRSPQLRPASRFGERRRAPARLTEAVMATTVVPRPNPSAARARAGRPRRPAASCASRSAIPTRRRQQAPSGTRDRRGGRRRRRRG